jgi:bifunctional non-homologous end joining protein LigD
MIHELVPSLSTLEMSKEHRGDKVLIDPSQNDYADTLASVYSARPHSLPTVSTPLEWKEVKPSLDPAGFTIQNIQKRIERKGDLFAGVMEEKIQAKNRDILSKLF